MNRLEKTINYHFKNRLLLKTALTHKSYINETGEGFNECNERLEFLGDSILGFVCASYLFANYPDRDEGSMTRARAAVVCEEGLVKIAKEWDLGRLIYLSRGEEKNNGRERHSILSDAVESVIAAVCVDGGFEEAKKIVLKFFVPQIEQFMKNEAKSTLIFDYKTALQEFCQKNGMKVTYKLLDEKGPAHDKLYLSAVLIDGKMYGQAEEKSKKKAEQKAAAIAFNIISKDKK